MVKLGSLQFKLLKIEEKTLVLDLHIREKVDLSPEKCKESYDMAFRFFSDFGYQFDKIKFTTEYGWLFDKKIFKYLGYGNLSKFLDDYNVIDRGGNSYSQILFRVFGVNNPQIDIKDLPENTTVRRNFKKALLNNEKFYSYRIEKKEIYLCDFEKLKEIKPVWLQEY
ncbi:MAG: hypothetical protein CR965_02135 [Paludibacter sp.]|nr:MAG: hypothetical protein CR965_02135 [Paludibacter sp.]